MKVKRAVLQYMTVVYIIGKTPVVRLDRSYRSFQNVFTLHKRKRNACLTLLFSFFIGMKDIKGLFYFFSFCYDLLPVKVTKSVLGHIGLFKMFSL